MTADVNARKRQLVKQILDNDTYLPDSGVYQRLEQVLLKMSKDDLGCLHLILSLKTAASCSSPPRTPVVM